MLENIEKVLVVIQEINKIEILLKEAIDISKENAAVLEILFVHENSFFELPDYFKHNKTQQLDRTRIKAEIEKVLSALGNTSSHAIFVEESDTVDRVVALNNKEEKKTYVVSFYHKHITAKLAKKISSPLLVMKSEVKTYTHILFPVDLNEDNVAFIHYIKTLFPSANIKLLYEPSYIVENYIFDPDFTIMPLDSAADIQIDQEMLEEQKKQFEALKSETGLKGELVDEFDTDLAEYINKQKADLLVLHSKNENFLFEDTLSEKLISSVRVDLFIL